MTRHPFFGRDPDSYNIDLDDANGEFAPDGSGRPGESIVFSALLFWRGQQHGDVTVGDAARVFCMPSDAVAYCIKHGPPWLFLGGADDDPINDRTIEVDGE